MKIVNVDNLNRESTADTLVAENINEYWGKKVVELLNDDTHYQSNDYFKLVENNHVLWRGMDELL